MTDPEVEGEICMDCGCRYGRTIWTASDELWLQLVGSLAGMLCPGCFDDRAKAQQMALRWVPIVESGGSPYRLVSWSKFGTPWGWDGAHNVSIDLDDDCGQAFNVVLECSCGARCYLDRGGQASQVAEAVAIHLTKPGDAPRQGETANDD